MIPATREESRTNHSQHIVYWQQQSKYLYMYSLKVSKDLSGTNSIFEMYMTVRINKTENVWGLTTKRMRFYGKKCHSPFMRLSDFIFTFSLKMQHQWSVCLYIFFPLENFCNNICFIKNTFNMIMRIFLCLLLQKALKYKCTQRKAKVEV